MRIHRIFIAVTIAATLTGVVSTANAQETPSPSGDVTVDKSTGKFEATLLAARAIDEAAEKIFSKIEGTFCPSELFGKTIYLYAFDQLPNIRGYALLKTQINSVEKLLKSVEDEECPTAETANGKKLRKKILEFEKRVSGGRASVSQAPFYLAAADGLSKLFGYLATNHSFRGVELGVRRFHARTRGS